MMKKIIDWVTNLPNWGKILLVAVIFLSVIGLGIYSFLPKGEIEDEKPKANLIQEMPDAEIQKDVKNRLKAYVSAETQTANANDYWNSLGGDEEGTGDGGLLVTGNMKDAVAAASARYSGEYLDPNVYSEKEIYYIKNNIKTKAEIDAQHVRDKEEEERYRASMASVASKPTLTQEQKDSMYFARMEKSYEMAMKYSQPQQPQPAEPVNEPEPEPELRHIELGQEDPNVEASSIDMNAFSDDGIITSLDVPTSGGVIHYNDAKIKCTPVKCTFLNSEKLVSGQRVIMRLLQDLILSDGTLIPVNTHITGTCKTGNRLQITVTAIHYGGKMFQTNIVAYDNDGTEGIYCPVLETKKSRESGKRIAGATAQGATSAVLGVLTGNPYMSRVASSSMSEVTRAIEDNGSISINVASGYVFYLLENN